MTELLNFMTEKYEGYKIAIFELGIFYFLSLLLKFTHSSLWQLNPVSYYWLCFTVLTGIWEASYITNKPLVKAKAKKLIEDNKHVWTEKYSLITLIPSNLAKEFYSEYGAWADREYMSIRDNWSIMIEGSHCVLCGFFSFVAIVSLIAGYIRLFDISSSISMAAQLMNSVLYIDQYIIECRNPGSVNRNRKDFPTGEFYMERPFIYINVFWTVMPSLVIFNSFFN